jgi:GAF domain-containing protein
MHRGVPSELSFEERMHWLERLSQASQEISGNLETMRLEERLTLIAAHAADILQAEVCAVLLVRKLGFLSLEASHGHRPGSFERGREFAIHHEPGGGLTGFIAHRGELFNAHGEELTRHAAVRGLEPTHAPSRKCHSLLAIPLKKRVGTEEKIIGLLRADNKKGTDGISLPSLRFTKEDEWVLQIFARAVVVALESAELVEQLGRQKDYLEGLFASSPTSTLSG